MEDLIKAMAEGLVENKEEITVTLGETAEDGTVVYNLSVAKDDMGRVIGRQGRVAKAIRTVVRSAAARTGVKATVEIS